MITKAKVWWKCVKCEHKRKITLPIKSIGNSAIQSSEHLYCFNCQQPETVMVVANLAIINGILKSTVIDK